MPSLPGLIGRLFQALPADRLALEIPNPDGPGCAGKLHVVEVHHQTRLPHRTLPGHLHAKSGDMMPPHRVPLCDKNVLGQRNPPPPRRVERKLRRKPSSLPLLGSRRNRRHADGGSSARICKPSRRRSLPYVLGHSVSRRGEVVPSDRLLDLLESSPTQIEGCKQILVGHSRPLDDLARPQPQTAQGEDNLGVRLVRRIPVGVETEGVNLAPSDRIPRPVHLVKGDLEPPLSLKVQLQARSEIVHPILLFIFGRNDDVQFGFRSLRTPECKDQAVIRRPVMNNVPDGHAFRLGEFPPDCARFCLLHARPPPRFRRNRVVFHSRRALGLSDHGDQEHQEHGYYSLTTALSHGHAFRK